eukprot:Gb_27727 [translate_table: standard]
MRAGLSTVQQTLTPEAARILNHAIADACRRGHGQTTPLHVAATLLAAPASHLRQACIRSHPNSSHPLQCRALELCFSVALDRLPAAQGLVPGSEPPISNALMAALKRAQAHQRRGCPEQQQQPLLAVKVELEQLIVSILDDPSVSRVMREASFSSPAVKATIEQSINMTSSHSPISISSSTIDRMGFRLGSSPSILGNSSRNQLHFDSNNRNSERDDANSRSIPHRNIYANPRLQGAVGASELTSSRSEDVRRLVEILIKGKKRNPVLVGQNEPEGVVKELVQRIEKGEAPEQLRGVRIRPIGTDIASFCSGNKDSEYIAMKFKELDRIVESCLNNGIILNVGDFKWLVEQSKTGGALGASGSSSAEEVVTKFGQLLARHGATGRLWLIGIATCETYLRCQVHHPSMESDWDLQPVPIAARPSPGLFSRFVNPGILSSSMESLIPLKAFPALAPTPRSIESNNCVQKMSCCSQCMVNYEQERASMEEEKKARMASASPHSRSADQGQQALPLWLQIAKSANGVKGSDMQAKDQELMWKQKLDEMQKKWNDTCRSLHPHFLHAFHPIISTEQLHEPQWFSSQTIDGNGKRQTEPAVDKSGVQDPHRDERVFPGSLDSLLRYPFQRKCFTPLLAHINGTAVEEISRVSVTQAAVSSHDHIFQHSVGAHLCEPPSSLSGSCHACTPPVSPVRTDLALGRSTVLTLPPCNISSVQERNIVMESHKERLNDVTECLPSNVALPIPPKVSTPCTDAGPLGSALSSFDQQNGKFTGLLRQIDTDAFKKLCKGLKEKVGWQCEAVSAVANTIMHWKSENGKRRGVGLKGDIWLLFLGPDRVGKRKMAAALSELVVFGSEKKLVCICLSSQDGLISSSWNECQDEHDGYGINLRGKTALDRIAEAVRQNPFSVVLLEDVDQADSLIHSSLLRAMEKGRLPDSHGREVSLGNVIFVMTASGAMENHDQIPKQDVRFSEEKLVAARGWPMQLLVESAPFEALISKCKRVSVTNYVHDPEIKDSEQLVLGLGFGNKRKADWIKEEQARNDISENVKKIKEPSVSLDLNLSLEENEGADFSTASHSHTEACQGSRDSSDLTVEQNLKWTGELFKGLLGSVDETVVFKPFDFENLADKIVDSISAKFFSIIGSEGLIEIDIKALEQILAFVWFTSDGMKTFEKWVDQVLVCSLMEVTSTGTISADTVVKLLVDKECLSGKRPPAVCLPSSILVNRRTKACQKAM